MELSDDWCDPDEYLDPGCDPVPAEGAPSEHFPKYHKREELTEARIDQLSPLGPSTIYDVIVPSLVLVTRADGYQSFLFKPKRGRAMPIGDLSSMTLTQARAAPRRHGDRDNAGESVKRPHLRSSRPTVAQVMREYSDKGLSDVTPEWAEKVKRCLVQHIIPRLGHIIIDELTLEHIQDWIDGEINFSQKGINKQRKILSAALTWAVKSGIIPFNPVLRTQPDKGKRPVPFRFFSEDDVDDYERRAEFPTLSELADLFIATPQLPAPWDAVIRLQLLTGQKQADVLRISTDNFCSLRGHWTVVDQKAPDQRSHEIIVPVYVRTLVESCFDTSNCNLAFPSSRHQGIPLTRRPDIIPRLRLEIRSPLSSKGIQQSIMHEMIELGISLEDIAITFNRRKDIASVARQNRRTDLTKRTIEPLEKWDGLLRSTVEKKLGAQARKEAGIDADEVVL